MTALRDWTLALQQPRFTELDEPRLLDEPPSSVVDPPGSRAGHLLDAVESAGLTGRGGAAFRSHLKMRGVRSRPAPRIVVANGAEGEPARAKDKSLLRTTPHLVLDGLQVAARIVEAERAFLYVHDDAWVLSSAVRALAER